ncbi:MAG TPA: heme biosynthesis HemY N-terminal domain-containing protein, partial [Nitrococcus sp.]|nr:heme biosynthesis HemY N-terminal domain-containing protein [Nitrococcus sp.]
MKRLFLILIILVLSVAAALWFKENNGYALFTVGRWTLQMSLFVFVGGLLALWIALNSLWGLLQGLWYMPAGMRLWAGNRRRIKARQKLVGGLVLLAEGRNKESEKVVLQGADVIDLPLLSYLVAAIAAQRQGAWSARDQYLELAAPAEKRAQIALGVLQAQLQMQAQQWEQAVAKLSWVRERAPKNHHALKLLAESAAALQDWECLAELLPDLRMNRVFSDAELEDLEVRTARARLRIASEQG